MELVRALLRHLDRCDGCRLSCVDLIGPAAMGLPNQKTSDIRCAEGRSLCDQIEPLLQLVRV